MLSKQKVEAFPHTSLLHSIKNKSILVFFFIFIFLLYLKGEYFHHLLGTDRLKWRAIFGLLYPRKVHIVRLPDIRSCFTMIFYTLVQVFL